MKFQVYLHGSAWIQNALAKNIKKNILPFGTHVSVPTKLSGVGINSILQQQSGYQKWNLFPWPGVPAGGSCFVRCSAPYYVGSIRRLKMKHDDIEEIDKNMTCFGKWREEPNHGPTLKRQVVKS